MSGAGLAASRLRFCTKCTNVAPCGDLILQNQPSWPLRVRGARQQATQYREMAQLVARRDS